MHTIPKIIHFSWFGPRPISLEEIRVLQSYRKLNPDHQMIMWTHSQYSDWRKADGIIQILEAFKIEIKEIDRLSKPEDRPLHELLEYRKTIAATKDQLSPIEDALRLNLFSSAGNLLRILIMTFFGGVYTETDNVPLAAFPQTCKASFVISMTKELGKDAAYTPGCLMLATSTLDQDTESKQLLKDIDSLLQVLYFRTTKDFKPSCIRELIAVDSRTSMGHCYTLLYVKMKQPHLFKALQEAGDNLSDYILNLSQERFIDASLEDKDMSMAFKPWYKLFDNHVQNYIERDDASEVLDVHMDRVREDASQDFPSTVAKSVTPVTPMLTAAKDRAAVESPATEEKKRRGSPTFSVG